MELIWRSGPAGASWLAIDTQLAQLIESRHPGLGLRVVPGGGRENLLALRDGVCQVATSIDFLAQAAYAGAEPYADPPMTQLRLLHTGWPVMPFHLILAADAGIDGLREMLASPQARIGVPPRSTSDELTFRRVMDFCGSGYQQIDSGGGYVRHRDYTGLVDAFTAGDIDAIFGATAAPAAAVIALSHGDRAAQLVALPADVIGNLVAHGYPPVLITADTYPLLQQDDIATAGMASALLTTDSLPGSVARDIEDTLLADTDIVRAIHPSLTNITVPVAAGSVVPFHHALARRPRQP